MAGTTEQELIGRIQKRYPDAQPRLHRAPGRVNLIGEHTDYNLGFVMPIAIQMACYTGVWPSTDSKFTVYSENADEEHSWPWEQIADAEPGGNWTDYVIGVAQQLMRLGHELKPCRMYIYSDVPTGAGLSSSAAIEVASAMAFLNGKSINRLDLAKLAQRAEREFVGMPCGIMDQYISVFGEPGKALQLDCRSLQHVGVEMPPDVVIVAVNTMVKHDLGKSEYPLRVQQCLQAVEVLQQSNPKIRSLRDATIQDVEQAAGRMDEVVLRRARHVVTEDARVQAFTQACRDGNREEMGRLFVASHRSLQHDYEVSAPELDFLVDAAVNMDGVYGSRMTGGGFGGCTVNLVRADRVEAFRLAIEPAYVEQFGVTPQTFICEPSAGAA